MATEIKGKLHITFVNPSVGTTYGGSESIIQQFASQLAQRQRVSVLTGHSPYLENRGDVWRGRFAVMSVPFSPRFTPFNDIVCKAYPRIDPYKYESLSFYMNVRLRRRARKLIRESSVISTHYRLDSKLFSNYARKKGVASVFHILGTAYGRKFFETDKSTLYVATTKYEAEILKKEQGAPIHAVVSPGVPAQMANGQTPDFDEREGLLFVARIQKTKGLDELVSIMQGIPNEMLTVVGAGPDMNYICEKAAKMGIADRIKLVGHKPADDVYARMRKAKLLVFPSHSETFGIVPLEALACGLPAVCTDLPQVREATGGNAFFHDRKDIDAWRESIRSLIGDASRWREMSKRGKDWAKDKTWDVKAREYEKCLAEAVDRNRRKA